MTPTQERCPVCGREPIDYNNPGHRGTRDLCPANGARDCNGYAWEHPRVYAAKLAAAEKARDDARAERDSLIEANSEVLEKCIPLKAALATARREALDAAARVVEEAAEEWDRHGVQQAAVGNSAGEDEGHDRAQELLALTLKILNLAPAAEPATKPCDYLAAARQAKAEIEKWPESMKELLRLQRQNDEWLKARAAEDVSVGEQSNDNEINVLSKNGDQHAAPPPLPVPATPDVMALLRDIAAALVSEYRDDEAGMAGAVCVVCGDGVDADEDWKSPPIKHDPTCVAVRIRAALVTPPSVPAGAEVVELVLDEIDRHRDAVLRDSPTETDVFLRWVGSPLHVAIWEAINRYVVACGGSETRISGARMDAVVAVEQALDALRAARGGK